MATEELVTQIVFPETPNWLYRAVQRANKPHKRKSRKGK